MDGDPVPLVDGVVLGAGLTGAVVDRVAGMGGGAALGRSPSQTADDDRGDRGSGGDRRPPRPRPAPGRRDGGPDVTKPVVGADRVGLPLQGAAQLGLELLEPVGTRSVGHDAPPTVLRRVVRARWACALTEPGEMSSASAICRSLRSE